MLYCRRNSSATPANADDRFCVESASKWRAPVLSARSCRYRVAVLYSYPLVPPPPRRLPPPPPPRRPPPPPPPDLVLPPRIEPKIRIASSIGEPDPPWFGQVTPPPPP